jgi:hypothetical protein
MEAIPVLIILGAPILSANGVSFSFVENIFIRIGMVLLLIYAVNQDILFGILTLLAIVTLLIERNQQLVKTIPKNIMISPRRDLYPMKAPYMLETQMKMQMQTQQPVEITENSATNLEDNIPDLKEGPNRHDAPSFFKSLGVL